MAMSSRIVLSGLVAVLLAACSGSGGDTAGQTAQPEFANQTASGVATGTAQCSPRLPYCLTSFPLCGSYPPHLLFSSSSRKEFAFATGKTGSRYHTGQSLKWRRENAL